MSGRAVAVFALLGLLAGCTSGSAPRAARTPSPSASATSPTPTPTPEALDDGSPGPEPPYQRLSASAALTGFVADSVSFVSTRTGWFLGTAQCGAQTCAALLQTRDAGRTFRRRTAPPVKVEHIRFADLNEGWAFGNAASNTVGDPGLWRTHDGGDSWKKVLPNPVPSLEAGSGAVWAIVLDTGGTFPQVFRGSTRGDSLRLVTQAGNRSAGLSVGHGSVYVVAEQGAGPIATTLLVIDPDGRQHRYQSPCGEHYEHDLSATGLQVAVGKTRQLVAVCSGEPGTGMQFKVAYASTDDGRSWHRRPNPPAYGYTSMASYGGGLAATGISTFMTGGRSPVWKATRNAPWRMVLDTPSGAGFHFIGFTDAAHGVALGWNDGAWMTDSAGEHWRHLTFS